MLDLTPYDLDWLNAERKATRESEQHHQQDNVELKKKNFPRGVNMTRTSCALCKRHNPACAECILESCFHSGDAYMKMADALDSGDFPAFHDAAVEMVATLKCKGELLDAEIAGREKPQPKQSAHEKGERFEGEVSDSAALPPKGSHLAYAEECRTPKRGERFVYKCITAGTAGMNFAGVERPHVTVTCWDKQARETSYGFYGEVDWDRLCRDTFGEGAEVVLLSPNLFIAGPVACGIYAGKYQYILARRIYKNLAAWSYTTNDGICGSHCSARDDTILPAAIIAAIREHNPPSCDACEHEFKAKAEEHYSGETFNKPVYTWHHGKKCFLSDKYEYTGEFRKPGDDAYETAPGDAGTIRPETQTPRWILRLVTPKAEEPKPPKWWEETKWLQDGWWVVWRGNGRPMTVDHVKDDRVYCNDRLAHKDWHPSNLSAANLDDLAYTVDGVQYLAYEDNYGNIRITDNKNVMVVSGQGKKIFPFFWGARRVISRAQWDWLQAQK